MSYFKNSIKLPYHFTDKYFSKEIHNNSILKESKTK